MATSGTLGIVSSAIGAVGSIVGGLLAAHTARLKAAQSENQALANIVPAFDTDLQEINQAVNSGQVSVSQAIAALAQLNQQTKSYLQAQVGKSGTAWSDSNGQKGICDKTCTAGCCVYHGVFGPACSLSVVALGGPPIVSVWGRNDPRIHGNQVSVPEVFASKYGGVDRLGYTLTWNPAPALASTPIGAASSIASSVENALGFGSPAVPQSGVVPTGRSNSVLLFGAFALAIAGGAIVLYKK